MPRSRSSKCWRRSGREIWNQNTRTSGNCRDPDLLFRRPVHSGGSRRHVEGMRADAATTRYRKNPGTGPNCRNPPEYGKRRLRKPPLKALLVFCASGSYRGRVRLCSTRGPRCHHPGEERGYEETRPGLTRSRRCPGPDICLPGSGARSSVIGIRSLLNANAFDLAPPA